MKCIICKKDKQEEDFNEEHVFPESIGGKYKIHTVCKECNSHFGKTIDNKFINSGVIRALNHKLKIENKNGKVVPYFKNTVVNPKNNSIRLKTFFDNKGNLKDTEFETTVQDTIVRFDESKSLNTILSE
ncbi:HNH endonuclease, partial [Methanobrevibacter smithii]